MKNEYLKRIVDKELDILLKTSGAVLIEGPKWCGKTRTAEERAASALYLNKIDEDENLSLILDTKPSLLLEGDTPRLIDEWQNAPKLWNGVRFEVDHRGGRGHFILTGSAAHTNTSKTKLHTGTGRIARLHMRPMTLYESLESNGSVSLESLFNGDDIEGISTLELEDVAFAIARGGWPEALATEKELATRHARNYVDAVVNTDISEVDGIKKSPARAKKLMRSLARNISTPVKLETILKDVAGDDRGGDINSDKTVTSYMDALRRLFVVEELPAWSPNMRSKTALRTSPKLHFVDPSIAVAALRTSPEGLMKDFNTFGLLFESLCVRDLRVYSQANDGHVYHYRDNSDLEADAVIELSDGRWGAVEVKMGMKAIDEAVKNLLKLKNKVDTEKTGEPSFLAVITAGKYALRTEEGVYIIPIGCLKD